MANKNQPLDLVDRSVLVALFSGGEEMKSMTESIQDARVVEEIRKLPRVDAVIPVKCKNCKHRDFEGFCNEQNGHDGAFWVHPEHYCACGEEKSIVK